MKAKLKRFLSSLLVVALLLQMAPFEALATDSAATADPPVVSSEPDESRDRFPHGAKRFSGYLV